MSSTDSRANRAQGGRRRNGAAEHCDSLLSAQADELDAEVVCSDASVARVNEIKVEVDADSRAYFRQAETAVCRMALLECNKELETTNKNKAGRRLDLAAGNYFFKSTLILPTNFHIFAPRF